MEQKLENLQAMFSQIEDKRQSLSNEIKQYIESAFAVRNKYSLDISDDETYDYWWYNCNVVCIHTRHEDVYINIYEVSKADNGGFIVSGEVCGSEYDGEYYSDCYAVNYFENLLAIASFINGVIEFEQEHNN